MKILFCVLSIVGLVVGAGLASGREIFVFFTRFGVWSFPSIILSFVIFWFLFSFFLFCVVIFLCFMVYRYGLGALNKLNFIMIPIVIVVMIISFFVLFDSNISLKLNCFEPLSIIYSLFYCGFSMQIQNH